MALGLHEHADRHPRDLPSSIGKDAVPGEALLVAIAALVRVLKSTVATPGMTTLIVETELVPLGSSAESNCRRLKAGRLKRDPFE
jgi:hypothetical protein